MNEKVLQAVIKLKDEFTKPLKGIKSSMEELGKQVDKSKKELANFNTGMQTVGKTAVAVGGTLVASLGSAFTISAKNAIEFESAFAGVMKTVNESSNTSYDDLSKGLIEMSNSMPQTASELAGIAEIAGQLGIETDNILGFTKTMAMLADTTNIAGEEGALALAKFMNVMGTSQGDVDKLGATIVELGNNMATTEADILSMATRLSDLGILADFSETQVMGWAAAMSSVGIEAEMGGTAMKKMVTEIERATLGGGESLQQFASIAGMSAEQYKQAFDKDASSATLAFLKGLEKVKESGGSISQVLDDMGIKEVRLRETIVKLASANEDVAKALGMSSSAWDENAALVNEANVRYGTTESQLKIMRNQITNASIDIGNALLPVIRDLCQYLANAANWFANLDPNIKKIIISVGLLTLGIGAFLVIGGSLLLFISSVSAAFVALGGAAGIAGMAVAFLTSPFLLVIAIIVLVIANIRMLKKNWDANLGGIQDKTKKVINTVLGWWKTFIDFVTKPISTTISVTKTIYETAAKNAKKKKDGSHAFGMSRVPRDGYVAQLHQGEKVLTKQEADKQEKGFAGGININIAEMNVREEADIEKIAREIARNLKSQRLAFAGGGN